MLQSVGWFKNRLASKFQRRLSSTEESSLKVLIQLQRNSDNWQLVLVLFQEKNLHRSFFEKMRTRWCLWTCDLLSRFYCLAQWTLFSLNNSDDGKSYWLPYHVSQDAWWPFGEQPRWSGWTYCLTVFTEYYSAMQPASGLQVPVHFWGRPDRAYWITSPNRFIWTLDSEYSLVQDDDFHFAALHIGVVQSLYLVRN